MRFFVVMNKDGKFNPPKNDIQAQASAWVKAMPPGFVENEYEVQFKCTISLSLNEALIVAQAASAIEETLDECFSRIIEANAEKFLANVRQFRELKTQYGSLVDDFWSRVGGHR